MNLTDRLIVGDDLVTEEQHQRSLFRKALSFLTKKWWRTLFLLLVLTGIFFVADIILVNPRSATVIMTLNYEQASDGLTPNATRFNMYEIKTEPVLQATIRYAGLQGKLTTDELSQCILVEARHEGDSGNDDDFISTSYRIDFRNYGTIPERSAKSMLMLLCKAYREYFYENYAVSKTTAGRGLDDLDISTEYLSRVDAFQLKINQMERYAGERMNESGDYRDPVSGLAFSDIRLRAQNISDYDLNNLQSYVIYNALSEDPDILRDQLLYRKRMAKIRYDKKLASYGVNNEAIDIYDKVMTSIYMVPTINEKSQISIYTAVTGMDKMVQKADDDLNEAIELFKKMESDQTIADAVVSRPGNKEQQVKVEELLERTDQKINALFADLVTMDQAYESTHVQRYMMFSGPWSAHTLRSALIESALMTLAVAVIGFGVIYLVLKSKESDGQSV